MDHLIAYMSNRDYISEPCCVLCFFQGEGYAPGALWSHICVNRYTTTTDNTTRDTNKVGH